MKPPRSLMGLVLACLLAAPAAADVPESIWSERIHLLAAQVAARMAGVQAATVETKLKTARKNPMLFPIEWQKYVDIVDKYDKGQGNTAGADVRDALLATQYTKRLGGDAKQATKELLALRKTNSWAYSLKVASLESSIADYEKQKEWDANIAKLSKAVAKRMVNGDAAKIQKELQELKKNDPMGFITKVREYTAFVSESNALTGNTPTMSAAGGATFAALDKDVQDWTTKLIAAYPGQGWVPEALGAVVQTLKKKDPAKYAELTGQGVNALGDYLSVPGVSQAIMGAGTGWANYQASKGKPKTTVPDNVNGKPIQDQMDPLDASDPNRPVLKVLEAMLQKDPKTVGSAMALRIGDYLVHGDEGKYLSAELRAAESVVKDLAASASAWVDQMVKGGKGGRVSVLYFGLGTGGLDMSWTGGDKALAALPAEGPLLADLVRDMKPWTGEAAAGKTVKGPLTKGTVEAAFAFYEDAAANAQLILDKKGASVKDMTLASIGQNEQNEGVPGGSGSAGKITGPIKGFDFKDLYLEGSVGNENVHQIKDPYGHGRHIILKMMTVSEGGKVYNKIGIYDVTNTGDVFGRKFDIGLNGSTNFVLDDRTPGMPEYKLSFKTVGGKTEIVFGRAGKSEPEHEIHTSVSELYDKRAQQAARDGSKISIGGQDFIVLGQGGAQGGLLFFPGDLQKRLDAGESQLTPSRLATGLSERLPDGRTLPASGKPQLRGGKINGEEYHLEWDDAAKAWKVAKGAGDPDPVATPPGGTTGGGTTNTSSGGGQGQTTTSSGGDGGADEAKQKAVIQNLLDGGYEVNKEVADGLSPEAAQNFMVISLKMDSKTPKPFAERHYMTAPGYKVVGIPAAAGGYKEDLNKRQPGEVIGIERYMALTAPNGDVSYYDVTDADIKRPAIYKPAGSCTADGKRLAGVSDAILLDPDRGAHALTAAGFSSGDAAKAFSNLREAMVKLGNPTNYLISGAKDSRLGVLVSGKQTMYFWPKVEEETTTSGAGDERSGQGTAYDNSIGGGDVEEGFPKGEIAPSAPAGAKGYLVKNQDGAALYSDDKDAKKAQRWWLVFTYVNNDGSKKQSRQIMVFDKTGTEDLATFPGLDKLSVSGTTKTPAADVPHFGAVWLIKGSDANQGKGVYGAFSNKDAKQVRDKPGNCLGPVIWWGVSAEEALAACEANEL